MKERGDYTSMFFLTHFIIQELKYTLLGGHTMSGGVGHFGGGFALLVVLFILLIIIGASWVY